MNLRDFKKDVEYIVGDFVDDCSLFIALNPHKSSEKLAEVISEAVDLYNELKDKANAKVEPKQRKAWIANLHTELIERTDALYEKLSAVVTAKEGE